MQQPALGIEYARQLVALEPEDPSALMGLGLMQALRQDISAAKDTLRKAAIVRYALISVGFVFIAALAVPSLDYVQSGYADGIGFTSRWWRESPTLAVLTTYPADQVVYTNAPEALDLYTHLSARAMPKKYESANQRPNENYDRELAELKKQLLVEKGIIVYFDPMMRSTLPSTQEILGILGLEVLEQTADGVIYGIKGQNLTHL
jgi:hypothetical protein